MTGAGKNLFDKDTVSDGYIENSDGLYHASAYYKCSDYIEVVPNAKYWEIGQIGANWGAWYDNKKHFVSGIFSYSESNERVLIAPNNARYMRLTVYKVSTGYDYTQTLIRTESFDNTFEPYTQGANNTISLGGTYYGFTIDVERGVLRSTWGYIAEYDGEELSGRWISDRDVYSPNTSPTIGAEVVYELTEPLELPLTPQTVTLLAGNNTLWTDGDEITITYKAKR